MIELPNDFMMPLLRLCYSNRELGIKSVMCITSNAVQHSELTIRRHTCKCRVSCSATIQEHAYNWTSHFIGRGLVIERLVCMADASREAIRLALTGLVRGDECMRIDALARGRNEE